MACGEAEFNEAKNPETLLNPTLIVQVLSAGTAGADQDEQFRLHRQLPSLRQYLLLDSRAVHAELYTKDEPGRWMLTATRDPATVLDLGSVEARCRWRGFTTGCRWRRRAARGAGGQSG